MGVGPVCQTSLSTGLPEWELGPRHAERSPISLQGFLSQDGIRSLFPACGAAAPSLVLCSTASCDHHKMTTVVIPARIRQPVQTASVRGGTDWLPELRSHCVPGSGYSEDVGLVPSTSHCNLSSIWAHSQADLALGWPPSGQHSHPASASQEGKDARPCKYFYISPREGCRRSSLVLC